MARDERVEAELTRSYPRRVYAIIARVPAGRVITYGAIAAVLGDPRKAREVGWAMAATPEQTPPLPAHRVINARGELSGGRAFGGYAIQRARLEAEGVEFRPDGRVDLDRYLWLPDETDVGARQIARTKIRRSRVGPSESESGASGL